MVAGKDRMQKEHGRRQAKNVLHRPRRSIPSKWRMVMNNVGPLWCGRCKGWVKQDKYMDNSLNRMIYVCKNCKNICQVGRDYCKNCKKWVEGVWGKMDDENIKVCPRCAKVIK